jgi:hypothetical protein
MLFSCVMFYVLGPILALLCAYFAHHQPLRPQIWFDPSPLPTLEGALAVNDALTQSIHFSKDYFGAESFAFDIETGDAYSGFSDGTVGRFDQDGNIISRVFFTGGFISLTSKSARVGGNGITSQTNDLYSFCLKEVLAERLPWNATAEKICGRPLGLRFHMVKDHLFASIYTLKYCLIAVSHIRKELPSFCTSQTLTMEYLS